MLLTLVVAPNKDAMFNHCSTGSLEFAKTIVALVDQVLLQDVTLETEVALAMGLQFLVVLVTM